MSNTGLRPRNSNEREIMHLCTQAHDWLANHLKIHSKMQFGRTAYWGDNAFHAGLWINRTHESVLNFRNLYGAPLSRLLRIIAHEARHAVQFQQGWLKQTNRSRRQLGGWETGEWKGVYYSGAYLDAPWEQDARAHEKPYADMIIHSGVIDRDQLKKVLSGSQTQVVYLKNETIEIIKSQHGSVHLYKASTHTQQQQHKRDQDFVKRVLAEGWYKNDKNGKWYHSDITNYKAKLKTFKKIHKATRTQYCDHSVAFLTETQYKNTVPEARFWSAQQNRTFYKSRPMQDSDLVY